MTKEFLIEAANELLEHFESRTTDSETQDKLSRLDLALGALANEADEMERTNKASH